MGIFPKNLGIMLAIEMNIAPFHQSEAAAMYTKQRAEKKNAHRRILEHSTEKKTAKERTRFLSQRKAFEMEAILCDIGTFFQK